MSNTKPTQIDVTIPPYSSDPTNDNSNTPPTNYNTQPVPPDDILEENNKREGHLTDGLRQVIIDAETYQVEGRIPVFVLSQST